METQANIICADVSEGLRAIPDRSVQCIVTSPPYYGLRVYSGITPRRWEDGSECVLGGEQSVHDYVRHIVECFREMKRVLHPSGTLWLNMGDCYNKSGSHPEPRKYAQVDALKPKRKKERGMSKQNLLMVPARVALALQADGWVLRQDIIWAKGLSFCPAYSGSVMPESTQDRATWSHEHVFHFSLSDKYFYDQDGCREPYAESTRMQIRSGLYLGQGQKDYASAGVQNPSDTKRRVLASIANGAGRNLRNIWVIPKQNYKEAHFATFPEKLIEPIVKLATSEKGCCSVCFAPLRRTTVREPVPKEIQTQFEASRTATVAETGRTDGHTHRKPNYRRKVLRTEWSRSCDCPGYRTIPQMVLDPFAGSGRAGIAAVRLNRSFTGIDASAEYCALARHGLRDVQRQLHGDRQEPVLYTNGATAGAESAVPDGQSVDYVPA